MGDVFVIATVDYEEPVASPIARGKKVSGVEPTPVTSATHSIATDGFVEKFLLVVRLGTIGAACTITIPTAAFAFEGLEVEVIDADQLAGTYNISVVTGGSETINKEVSLLVTGNGDSVTLRRISSTELVLR